MPWHTSERYVFSPINATSKKRYRGINTVCLWAAAQAKGHERGEWATYQQWQEERTGSQEREDHTGSSKKTSFAVALGTTRIGNGELLMCGTPGNKQKPVGSYAVLILL
jgi:hypothetical protein